MSHINWVECPCKMCRERLREASLFGLMLQRACIELPDAPLDQLNDRANSLTDKMLYSEQKE